MSEKIHIQNLTSQRVFLRFNSGRTHHLAANETIEDVASTDIKSNSKIDKLVERRIISITQKKVSASPKRKPPTKASDKKSTSK